MRQIALILGEDEMQHGLVAVKPLRSEGEQVQCAWDALASRIGEWVSELD